MIKNKEHSDLYYKYQQLVGRINHCLISIQVEKNHNWDIWCDESPELFLKLKKQSIGDYRHMLNSMVKESKYLKQAIKNSNKNYNIK